MKANTSTPRNGTQRTAYKSEATPPTQAPANRRSAPFDMLPHRRDSNGNQIPSTFVYTIPVVGPIPVETTALHRTIERIEAARPGWGNYLRHFYNHRLLHQFSLFQRAVEDIEQSVASRVARTAEQNAALEGKIAAEQSRAAIGVQAIDDKLQEVEVALEEAHWKAALAVAAAGGAYDPQNPDPACALRCEPSSLEIIAGQTDAPYRAEEALKIPPLVKGLCSLAIGALVGVSFGMTVHALDAEFLRTLSDDWLQVVIWGHLGIGVTLSGNYGIQRTWALAAEERYLRGPLWRQVSLLVLALVAFVLIVGADMALERQGLLALMAVQTGIQNLSGGDAASSTAGGLFKALMTWLLPLVVTGGYALCAAGEGFMIGRRKPVEHRLLARQDELYKDDLEARHADPLVQEAVATLALVKALLHKQESLQQRLEAITRESEARIAMWEGNRQEVTDELNLEEKYRRQDALNQIRCAQDKFDRLISAVLCATEPTGNRWKRAWRAWRGIRQ